MVAADHVVSVLRGLHAARPPAPHPRHASMRNAGPAEVYPVAPQAAARAATLLWIGLAVLVAARALSAWVPTTHGWGLNALRFAPAGPGWALWAATALALIPALARRAAPVCGWIGEATGRRPWPAAAVWAIAMVTLLWLLPDRLSFLGDSLMRRGTVIESVNLELVYPQALKLDLLLHVALPRVLMRSLGLGADVATRALGALEAALLTMLAVAFARALDLRGAACFAATSVAAFGGYLGLYTGYSKAATEMCAIVAAIGACGVLAVRGGRGLLALGALAALALALHRMALALLPAVWVADVLWLRRHGGAGRWRRPAALLALALPVAALAVAGPRIGHLLASFDLAHHVPQAGAAGAGGPVRAALALPRLADLLNAVALLSPVALAATALPLPLGRSLTRRPEAALLAALALPLVALILAVQPQQGIFRDLDVLAPTAVGLSLVAAWLVGEVVRSRPSAAWLAVPAVLAALAPAVTWLSLNHDASRGTAWVRSFVLEPPRRADFERGKTWDYLGHQAMGRRRWNEAAAAFAYAAETMPSPRILTQWGMAESMAGDLEKARGLYRRALALDPAQPLAWRGLASSSFRLGDYAEARRAADEVQRLGADAPELPELLRALEEIEAGASRPGRSPPQP